MDEQHACVSAGSAWLELDGQFQIVLGSNGWKKIKSKQQPGKQLYLKVETKNQSNFALHKSNHFLHICTWDRRRSTLMCLTFAFKCKMCKYIFLIFHFDTFDFTGSKAEVVLMGPLACGTPEAADQSEHWSLRQKLKHGKSFGEDMKDYLWTASRKFSSAIPVSQEEQAVH